MIWDKTIKFMLIAYLIIITLWLGLLWYKPQVVTPFFRFCFDLVKGPDFLVGEPKKLDLDTIVPISSETLSKLMADCAWDPVIYHPDGRTTKLKDAVVTYMKSSPDLSPEAISKVNTLADKLCLPRYETYERN